MPPTFHEAVVYIASLDAFHANNLGLQGVGMEVKIIGDQLLVRYGVNGGYFICNNAYWDAIFNVRVALGDEANMTSRYSADYVTNNLQVPHPGNSSKAMYVAGIMRTIENYQLLAHN